MKAVSLQLLLVVAFAALAQCTHGSDFVYGVNEFSGYMANHLAIFSKDSHPQSPETRKEVQTYVRTVFDKMGLQVEEQTFNTSVSFGINDVQEVIGTNIIGIREGSSTKNLMVIGAHYDSTGITENHYPERENGVGIATLIEVARAVENSIRNRGFVHNYTIIYAAFDLNTKEQKPEGPGFPGSYYFVHDWLKPLMKSKRLTYRGSFILDSIATYNTDENSQNLPADFVQIFPDAYETITATEKKGNFLAAVSNGGGSKQLLMDFEGHYNYDRKQRPFRLQTLVGNLSITGTATYGTVDMFDDQASVHFWSESLPSVLLTDTRESRSLPTGEQPTMDNHYVFWNPERQAFVQKTYQALSYTILDSQTTYVGLTKSTASSTASTLFATVAFAALARLLA